MSLATLLLGWAVGALVAAKVIYAIVGDEFSDPWSGEDVTGLCLLSILWPVTLGAMLLFRFGKIVKRFIVWDHKAWAARRATRRIESDLSKENDGP